MINKLSFALIVFLVSTAAFGISSDPLEVGVGARPLGMGKAFVGMMGNQFINPSSIAGIHSLNVLSMSGRILQDVDYVTIGLANPFAFGTLGIGYVGSGIASIPLTRMVGSTVETYGATDYSNNVLMLTYATQLMSLPLIPKIGFMEDVDVGTNLKFYSQGFSNTSGSMEGAAGSGMDLDLAMSYQPDAPYSVGVNMQNALPASMGGKFTWQRNSVEEGIGAVLKYGGTLKILGQEGLRRFGDHVLTLAIDSDNYISSVKPSVWHIGAEWWPLQMFAIRMGLDQQSSLAQVTSDLTGGIGLKVRGFNFDYAYHQYSDISENTTHYFSIGYAVEPKKEMKIAKRVKRAAKAKRKTFADVPAGYWAKDPIEILATAGIISGYPDGTFQPAKTLSRAELCTLLIKAEGKKVKKPDQNVFVDLPASHWAAPFVAAAVRQKLVGGYPDGTFKPKKALTRAEAIKIIASFDGLKARKITMAPFPDMPPTHWAAPYVQAAKNAGLLDYLKGKNFEPNRKLTRAEAAAILYRSPSFR